MLLLSLVRVTGHQRIRIYLLLKDFWVFHSKLNKQIVVRVALSFFKQWNLEQKPAIFIGAGDRTPAYPKLFTVGKWFGIIFKIK